MKNDKYLKIGGKSFSSRLMVGTGKYKSSQDMVESLSKSETEIITVAVRRIKNDQNGDNLLDKINWTKYWMLYGYQCNGGHHGLAPNGGNKPSDFCNEKTGLPWVMHDGCECTHLLPLALLLAMYVPVAALL